MLVLRQSTAIDIRMGQFVDSTDGVTPETGITLGAADQAEVLKADGAATVSMAGTFAAVTGADGWYDYTCATGDVDTVGEVVFIVQDSSVCLPVFVRAQVVEEAVYDALFASSAAGFATIAALATVDSNVDAILLDTAEIGAAGAGLTDLGGMSTGMRAEVNSECDTALADYDGPTNAEMVARTILAADYFDPALDVVARVTLVDTTTANADMVGTDSAATATALAAVDSKLDSMSGATFSSSTDSLEAIRNRGDAAWVTGGGGSAPTVVEIREEMDSNSTQLAAIVADTNELQGDDIPGLIAALNDFDPTADAVANVTLVATTTTNTDMRGTDSANTVAPDNASIASILTDTGTTLPSQISGLNNISVSDVLTTQMTESYAADNVAPTLAQALFLVSQNIGDFSISGTTITTKRLNGSTTAATYTLDDGTNPTSRTRAT